MSKEFKVEINTIYTDDDGETIKRIYGTTLTGFDKSEIDVLNQSLPQIFHAAKDNLPKDETIIE